MRKNGELYLPNIAKSVQNFLNYLDLKIKEIDGRVEHDTAFEILKSTDYAIATRDDDALLNNTMLFSLEELSVSYVFASSICRLSKREFLVFCEGRLGGDFDPAKLFMRKVTVNPDYSLGLGPVQIAVDSGGTGDTAYSILNACSIKVSTGLHAGRIYLYYLKRFYNTQIDEPYCIYSDDDGATWSTPVDMSPFIPNIVNWKIVAIGPGKAIQLKHGRNAGRIILPCWHGDQNYPGSQAGLKSFILYSDDGGSTYTVGAESMYSGSNECQVAELKEGGFALLTRDASQQKAIEYSYDGGLTLVEPRKLDEIITTRVQSGFLQCQNNFDLSVPKLIVSTPFKAGVREDIGLWVSYDEKTFQLWKQVATGLGSYSDLMPIDESNILVTYSAGRVDANRDIKAIVVNLKSILMGGINMSIVLKSNKAYTGPAFPPALDAYKARVLADGGVIKNEDMLVYAFLFMREYGFDAAKVFSATSANWGIKESSGNVTKLYNLFDASGDINLVSGQYPLSSSGGKFSFYSAGSASNKFESNGVLTTGTNKNLSMFNAYEKGASTTATAAAVSELWGSDTSYRGLTILYSHVNNQYSGNGINVSGAITGVPYTNDISMSISPNGMFAYQGGVKVAEDLVISTIPSTQFKLYLASLNAGLASAQGYYYANITCQNLTINEEKAFSSFVGEFI